MGHAQNSRRSLARPAATMSSTWGRMACCQRRLVGHVGVGGGHPADRGVEVGEAVLPHPGRHLGAEAAGQDVLVDDQQPAGAGHLGRPPAPGPTGSSERRSITCDRAAVLGGQGGGRLAGLLHQWRPR